MIEGSGPLLIEEPENSLHPEIVRLIPRMLARLARRTGRQLILSTHSLDLLCGQGVGTEEILLLNPREESTSVRAALDLKQAADLLDRGVEDTSADPQMALFGE